MVKAKRPRSKEFPVSHQDRKIALVSQDFYILIKAIAAEHEVTWFEALTKLVRMGYEVYLQRKSLD